MNCGYTSDGRFWVVNKRPLVYRGLPRRGACPESPKFFSNLYTFRSAKP